MQQQLADEVIDEIREAFRNEPRLGAAAHLDLMRMEGETLILEGEVPSIAAKKRALEIAAAHEAVDAIADRLRVKPAAEMSDREVRTALAKAISGAPEFQGHAVRIGRAGDGDAAEESGRKDIVIEVDQGVVTLNGRVGGLVSRRLAGAMAWWVPGVRDVVNGLEVVPPEEDAPIRLEEAVRCVLDCDPEVEAGQIRVGVRHRDVRLTGLVPTEAMQERAERDAWSILGVDRVINDIGVKRGAG